MFGASGFAPPAEPLGRGWLAGRLSCLVQSLSERAPALPPASRQAAECVRAVRLARLHGRLLQGGHLGVLLTFRVQHILGWRVCRAARRQGACIHGRADLQSDRHAAAMLALIYHLRTSCLHPVKGSTGWRARNSCAMTYCLHVRVGAWESLERRQPHTILLQSGAGEE